MFTVYTKQICPYCIRAKALLRELDISYEEIDITDTPEVILHLERTSHMRTVPQIFAGETCLGGYSDILRLHTEGRLIPYARAS